MKSNPSEMNFVRGGEKIERKKGEGGVAEERSSKGEERGKEMKCKGEERASGLPQILIIPKKVCAELHKKGEEGIGRKRDLQGQARITKR